MHGTEDKFVQDFGGKPWRKRSKRET